MAALKFKNKFKKVYKFGHFRKSQTGFFERPEMPANHPANVRIER